VDVLTAGEALALLEKRLGQTLIDNERAQAEELAQRMGYLPLALVLAAAQMNLGVTWEELLTAFRTMQGPLEALDLDEAKTREESLRLSFDLSYEHLSREDQKHYRLLGVLAPKAPFTAGDAMVVWGEGDESAAIGTLRRLAARALIEFVETALPGRPKEAADSKGPALFRQHLLLRDDALRRMTPEEQKETVACHVSHYLALAQGARTTQDYLPVDTALAQVRAVLRRAQRGYAGDGGLVAAEGDAARKLLIFAMSTLTQYWSLRCMYHEWIEWNQEVLKCNVTLGNRQGQAASFGQLGAAYAALNEPKKAIEYYRQAQALNVELGDRRGQAAALGGLGAAYAALGESRQAAGYYEQALALSEELGDRKGQAAAYGQLGAAYAALNEPRKAIEYYRQAQALNVELGDRRGQAAALGGLGAAYAALNEPKKAIEYYEQAQALNVELGDRRGQAASFGQLGAAYAALNEPKKAIEYHQQSLALSEELGDRRGQAAALGGLGAAYAALNEPKKAIEYHQQSLALSEELGDRRGQAAALGGLGAAYAALNEPKKAIEYYQQALALDIELGDEKGQAQALGALGAAHGRSGDWAHAIEHYERAAAIQKRIEDWFHLAKTLGGLTRAYRQVGNIKRAIEVTRYNVSISRGWQLELAKQQLHELLASQDEPRQDSS
jgi:tetratricopeptide (TPR) repeat protein